MLLQTKRLILTNHGVWRSAANETFDIGDVSHFTDTLADEVIKKYESYRDYELFDIMDFEVLNSSVFTRGSSQLRYLLLPIGEAEYGWMYVDVYVRFNHSKGPNPVYVKSQFKFNYIPSEGAAWRLEFSEKMSEKAVGVAMKKSIDEFESFVNSPKTAKNKQMQAHLNSLSRVLYAGEELQGSVTNIYEEKLEILKHEKNLNKFLDELFNTSNQSSDEANESEFENYFN